MGQPEELGHSVVRLSGGASSATQDGAIVGSPYYMSPEGAQHGAEAIDRTSDVYLLGATLYEMLTGKPPRQGSSQSELIDLARTCRPAPPRKVDGSVPKALSAICMKAMAFAKEERYATPMALAEDIERHLAGGPTSAYREPFLTRSARWIRRHRRGLLRAAGLACVVSLAFWGISMYRQAYMYAEREAARGELAEFYRLADEAEYFAANSDSIGERAPYYDLAKAVTVGKSAVAIAAKWGADGWQLPLVEQREEMLRAQYDVLLRMAQLTLWRGHTKDEAREASSFLDRAKGMEEASRGYYQLRAECLQLLGEDGKAAEEEQAAIRADTAASAKDHFLAGERLRMKDVESAAEKLGEDSRPDRAHVKEAIEEYRAALAIEPRHFWARFQLGRCLMGLEKKAEGAEALSACVALKPLSPWAYTARGLASALAGRFEESEADLQRAIKLDSKFQAPRLNLGIAHWLAGNRDRAIADFDAVMAAPPESRLFEAAYYRGQLRLEKDELREALDDFSTVIEARGDFRPAYWFRALAEFRLRKYEEGQADLTKFVSLGARASGDESRAQSHFVLGCTLRRAGLQMSGTPKTEALVRASDELRATISLGATDMATFEQLGKVYEYLGKAQEAIKAYTQGIDNKAVSPPGDDAETESQKVSLLNLRGWAYAANDQKRFELARDDFSEALRLEPSNAEAHAGLGYALARLGNGQEARREASTAALLGSHNYVILHNVACIYGCLSEAADSKAEQENLALAALGWAMALSPVRNGASEEVAQIREEIAGPISESSFPQSLRSRTEFQQLLSPISKIDR
jgi:tetratricopeptide (TPR) repeat protein